jgi:uncharacterized protein YciI
MPLYAVTIRITATPDQVVAVLGPQMEMLQELGRTGRIRLAGKLGQDDGFLALFEAKDLLDARATAEAFPLIRDGLASWTLRLFEELDQ